MSGPAALTAVCLLLAGVVARPSMSRRLRRAVAGTRAAARAPWPGLLRGLLRGPASETDLAASVSELAVLLRAGLLPARAWAQVAAGHPPLAHVAEVAARGGDVAGALRSLAPAGRGAEPAALLALAATWQVCAQQGASVANVLERLADSLRTESDAADARRAALAAPVSTARVLGVLPVLGLGLAQLVGADPVQVLTGTAAGRVSGAIGATLAAIGLGWTRRLVRRAGAR